MNLSFPIPRLSTSLALLVLVALLPLFGLVTYTSLQAQQGSLAHTREHLLDTAQLTALRHERTVEGARQLLGAMASTRMMQHQDASQCTGYLKGLHGKYPFYTNLGLLNLNGNIVCHAINNDRGRFLGDRFYFKQALATESFVIGEYIIGRTSGRPSLTFGMPVVDDQGAVSGVVFAALDVEKLAGSQNLTARSPVSVTVTDRNGKLVGANTPLSGREGTQAMSTALFSAVKALPTQAFDAVDLKGEPRIYASVGVGHGVLPGLFVTASMPREAVLTPAKNQLALALALLGLFAAVGVLGARWVANRTIVEPTRRLLKQVNALAGHGDADQAEAPSSPQNELAGLTRAFNRMAAILQAREAERDSAERQLKTRVRQHEAISQLSVEVASASMLQRVLQCVTRSVADVLAIDLCKVLHLTLEPRQLLLVAGRGWKPGLVGTALVDADAQSQAGYTLRAGEPVFVEDMHTDSRFQASALLAEHGVVSSISVTIEVQGKPWGLLGADSRSPRGFTHDDTHFMQSAANLIALAIERMAVQADLVQHSRSMNEAQRIAHLGSWEFDIASQTLIWSDEISRITGMDLTGLSGGLDDYLNLVHPDDREQVEAAVAPMRHGRAPVDSEHRIVRPDGSIRCVRTSGELRRDDQGRAVAVCGTALDVTDLQAAQVRAEEMAELLAEAQHIADMGSWSLDIATGLMHWPAQTCHLVGIEAKDFGGTLEAAMQFVLPEDQQRLLDAYQRSASVGSVYEVEFRIRRSDDEVRWVRQRGVLKSDALGHKVRWLGMVMDITDSKLAEQNRFDLLAREQTARRDADAASHYYRSLFESAPGCYLVLTPHDYRIVGASDAYLEATMTTRAQLSGQSMFDMFPDDPAEPAADGARQLRASLERVRHSGLSDVMAVQRAPIRRPEAEGGGFEERFWSTVNSPIVGPGGELAYIIHRLEDVTEYLRIKGQLGEGVDAHQALASRSQLIEADIVLRSQELGRAREALAQSQALLGMASRISRVGAWSIDLPSQTLTWSEEVHAIHEMPLDYAPTLAEAVNFYAPECLLAVQDAFDVCATQGLPYDSEFQMLTAEGKKIWVRAMGEAVRDAAGAIVRVQGALQDISAQKQAESRERSLSAKLATTLESITDGFFLLDKDWNFAYLNGQAEHMLQRGRQELLGKNVWQEFPGSVGSPFEREYRRAVQAQRTVCFEAFYTSLDTWFDIHAYPTDEGLAVYFQDLTPRRLARAQLRLLETAVSHLSDIVVITQVDAAPELEPTIVFVNGAFEERTGYSRDEVMGKSPEFFMQTFFERSEDASVAARPMWRPGQGEMRILARDGGDFWLDVNAVALIDENESLTHWVSVGRDITERRQAREEILQLNSELEARVQHRTVQLEAANQELEAFSYSVSHDLSSPLKSIDGFSHLLERALSDTGGEKAKHYLRRIRAGVRHMGELIDGLLSLAQLSRDTLQLEVVDLSAIARRLAQECREREPERRVEVRIQDAMRLQGDARLLSVVMQNLLGNAWKFTARQQNAHIEIGSHAGTRDAIGETVYFIKDNGAGFDMAHADKLFGTFERLHAPADFSGTGIGLATVKRVIERHAGRVWAQAQEGEGACFYFTLGAGGMTPQHGKTHFALPQADKSDCAQ
ncbi:MAG: domain S-box protein [Polaromonas sp.]|nr:domain S-box protein [Polaromonas sp.]